MAGEKQHEKETFMLGTSSEDDKEQEVSNRHHDKKMVFNVSTKHESNRLTLSSLKKQCTVGNLN